MKLNYRTGNLNDVEHLKQLAMISWRHFQYELTKENWTKLSSTLSSDSTYIELLKIAVCTLCETIDKKVIGMAFFVPSGNATEIYDKSWSYIRFVSVNPLYSGHGIGRHLTKSCIELARENNEQLITLHTSEIMNTARHIYESMGFEIMKELEPILGKKYWLYKLELQ